MTKSRKTKKFGRLAKINQTKAGFTIIEVMLFLGISGLILVGILGGTYGRIGQQRYNDSIQSFAEYLRQNYSEALSPESLGNVSATEEHQKYGQSNQGIYGKILVFGADNDPQKVYSATLVGKLNVEKSSVGFIDSLKEDEQVAAGGRPAKTLGADVQIACETIEEYTTAWETNLNQPGGTDPVKGAIIIARSPFSSTIQTAGMTDTNNINFNQTLINSIAQNNCDQAKRELKKQLKEHSDTFSTSNDITFCLKSENSAVVRGVQILANAHNSSGVKVLTETESQDVNCK